MKTDSTRTIFCANADENPEIATNFTQYVYRILFQSDMEKVLRVFIPGL